MKPVRVVNTAVLFLILSGGASVLRLQAQEDAKPAHPEEARPAQEARPAEEARPEARPAPEAKPEARPQQEARPPQHPEEARPPEHVQEARPPQHEEAKPPQHEEARPVPVTPGRPEARPAPATHPEHGPTPEQGNAMQIAWEGHRAQHWQTEHRDWRARGGYHGYRIPQERYVAYFGCSHIFPIYSVPFVVVGGFPRFQYQGLWFSVVDPWPEYWAADWFYSDDVYVAYINDGYYLCDTRYPGVYLAVDVAA